MIKYKVVCVGLFVLLASPTFSKTSLHTITVQDTFSPTDDGAVSIQGYIGQKLQLCIDNRVMAQDIERVVKPFRDRQESGFGGFRCEYWGKWFTSAALGYAYQPTPEHRAVIEKAVQSLLATQTEDGYIGTYQPENQLGGWDAWGRKYVLLGLIAYYDLTGDESVLQAARRSVDYLLTQVGPGKVNLVATGYPGWKGLPPSSILEPVVLLYQRTGEKKYLDFAKYIVAQWNVPNELAPNGLRLVDDALAGVPAKNIGAPKAYEQMSCFEGLCELYRVTGNHNYLDAALNLANSIRKTERTIIGSGSNHELWCDGAIYQTEVLEQPLETCVTTTWMKFCYQVLRLTGDPLWADELELTLYNAMIAPMTPDGSWWAYYSPLVGQRVASHYQHPDVGLSCCVANGPRGLLLTPRWAVMSAQDGPVVNLYAPGSAVVKLADGTKIKIVQETNYPQDDKVVLTIRPEKARRFALRLRIPAWSQETSLAVNGRTAGAPVTPGTYAKLERQWKSGDQVELILDLRGRVVSAPSGAPGLAIQRGPVVLALDNRLAQPQDIAVRLMCDENGYVDLKPCPTKPDDIWMAFEAPFEIHRYHVFKEKTTLVMCDYASAGNRWSADNLFRVWLPQPMFLRQMYAPDTWKLMYPDEKTRPEIPGVTKN